mmetsp:Transcript_15327/g.37631  ORF Transcript_15327/g.37631 Transcript_15327/m.37631 type:complete len:214 (-) Transcript_15327:150-791(-)
MHFRRRIHPWSFSSPVSVIRRCAFAPFGRGFRARPPMRRIRSPNAPLGTNPAQARRFLPSCWLRPGVRSSSVAKALTQQRPMNLTQPSSSVSSPLPVLRFPSSTSSSSSSWSSPSFASAFALFFLSWAARSSSWAISLAHAILTHTWGKRRPRAATFARRSRPFLPSRTGASLSYIASLLFCFFFFFIVLFFLATFFTALVQISLSTAAGLAL